MRGGDDRDVDRMRQGILRGYTARQTTRIDVALTALTPERAVAYLKRRCP